MLSPNPLASCSSAIAACSSPSSSRRASRRAFSAAIASRLLCEFAFRSSDALPNEKARRRRDLPGRLGSCFSSASRFAAGESAAADDSVVLSFSSVSVLAGSEDEAGWDRGDGLFARFSSGLAVAFDSDDGPSRA